MAAADFRDPLGLPHRLARPDVDGFALPRNEGGRRLIEGGRTNRVGCRGIRARGLITGGYRAGEPVFRRCSLKLAVIPGDWKHSQGIV